MRRNRGLLLLLSTCLMVVFIVLSTRPFAELLVPVRVAEERSAFSRKRKESSRNDEPIARSQVKLAKIRDTD